MRRVHEGACWDSLCALGLPVNPVHPVSLRRSRRSLVRRTLEAARSATAGRAGPREVEALQALVLAIRTHYPSVYECIAQDASVGALVPAEPGGRILKMARIARAVLGEYL